MKKISIILMIAVSTLAFSSLFAQLNGGPSKLLRHGIQPPPTAVPMGSGPCIDCATPENEPPVLGPDGIDVTNGGCWYQPEAFTNVVDGSVYCSNINTYLSGSDGYTESDWYRLVLTEPKTIYWSVNSPIDGQVAVASGPCATGTFIYVQYTSPGVYTYSATLPAGEYYFVYLSSVWLGDGIPYPYMTRIATTPPGAPETWCSASIPTLSQWSLIILGMVLLGAGTFYILGFKGASA
ncbi:MAG: hypothetical protein NT040_02550 [Bacteroidetes bacterium]|nr:hypothetical protein [Bacteroidota bacterium]